MSSITCLSRLTTANSPYWVMIHVEVVMKKFVKCVRNFLVSEDGPTAVEYAVMLALIVVVCLTAIQAVGTNAANTFNDIATDISDARSGSVN